jgi:hypothetical protein
LSIFAHFSANLQGVKSLSRFAPNLTYLFIGDGVPITFNIGKWLKSVLSSSWLNLGQDIPRLKRIGFYVNLGVQETEKIKHAISELDFGGVNVALETDNSSYLRESGKQNLLRTYIALGFDGLHQCLLRNFCIWHYLHLWGTMPKSLNKFIIM